MKMKCPPTVIPTGVHVMTDEDIRRATGLSEKEWTARRAKLLAQDWSMPGDFVHGAGTVHMDYFELWSESIKAMFRDSGRLPKGRDTK